MLPSSSVSMYYPRELKLTSTWRIYTHIHTHFIHNSPKLVTTPNAINKMHKQPMSQPYSEINLSYRMNILLHKTWLNLSIECIESLY